jgi:hypothetical protein
MITSYRAQCADYNGRRGAAALCRKITKVLTRFQASALILGYRTQAYQTAISPYMRKNLKPFQREEAM